MTARRAAAWLAALGCAGLWATPLARAQRRDAGARSGHDAGATTTTTTTTTTTRDAGAATGATGAGTPLPVATALAQLQTARQSVRNTLADFDQERTMGLFSQTVRARGLLVVQPPGNVRWEVVAPARGVFIVAQGRVAYSAGGSTGSASAAQVGPLGAVLGDLATFLGGQLASLQQRYDLAATSRAGAGGIVLTAAPREPAVRNVVDRVVLTFRSDGRAVEQIEMHEPSGDSTRIVMRNIQVNSSQVTPASFRP